MNTNFKRHLLAKKEHQANWEAETVWTIATLETYLEHLKQFAHRKVCDKRVWKSCEGGFSVWYTKCSFSPTLTFSANERINGKTYRTTLYIRSALSTPRALVEVIERELDRYKTALSSPCKLEKLETLLESVSALIGEDHDSWYSLRAAMQ